MERDLKKGMWCLDEDGRLGLTAMDDVYEKNGTPKFKDEAKTRRVQEPTFHLVNEKGETTLVVYRTWDGLTQAPYKEIPQGRIEGITRDEMATLGYV